MEARPRISAGRRDHLLTFLAEGMVLVATIVVYKLAKDHLGTDGFERYTVVRRTVTFLQMIGLCGLGVGLVRSAALALAPGRRVALLRRAARRIGLISAGLMALALLLPGPLALFFFGTSALAPLTAPIALMTIGVMAHTLIYGYLRGTHRMTWANALQVISMAVVPNLAMLLLNDLVMVLWATGLTWTIVSGAMLARGWWEAPVERNMEEEARMLRYGLLRLPGDVVFAGLLTLPVYLVDHVQGLGVGAQVAFGITLINVAGAAYSPLSLLLLPSAAGLIARGNWAQLDQRIARVMRFSVWTALLLVIGFEAVARPFLTAYLHEAGAAMEPICRIVFVGAFFYGVFVALRSVLDAYYTAPRNTFNLAWSFGLFLPMAVIYARVWPQGWMAALLVVIPLALLFVLTWRGVRWIRADLRAKEQAGAHDLRVLEFVALPRSSAITGDGVIWTVADPLSLTGLFAGLRGMRAVRAAEHRVRPDLIVARGGALAVVALLVARRPVVLVLDDGPVDRWSRLAALGAALVICPSRALADRFQWRERSVRVLEAGRDADTQLIHSLRGLHSSPATP